MSTYVYGIVSAAHPQRLTDLTGVGEQRARLRSVVAGDVAAVVSDAPPELRAKRRDLLAHEEVLEGLCAQGATLPMRFGFVADDDDTLAREIAEQQPHYLAMLSDVEGKAELNVKAWYDEAALLRDVLAGDATLRQLNEELRSRDGGSGDERLRFGELVATAVRDREARDADAIIAMLGPNALRRADGPAVGGCFLNTSFLVRGEDAEAFQEAVRDIDQQVGDAMEVRVHGPLPPYSFTATSG